MFNIWKLKKTGCGQMTTTYIIIHENRALRADGKYMEFILISTVFKITHKKRFQSHYFNAEILIFNKVL
jgi:hypothetical protein